MKSSAKIKLFVFDFDGTALGGHVPYEQFPRSFVAFIDELDCRDIRWATNTTWGPDSQYSVIKRSRVKSNPVFLAGNTGLLLATVNHGRLIHDIRYEQKIKRYQRQFHDRHWPRIRRLFQVLLKRNLVDSLSYNFYPLQCMITFTCSQRNAKKAWLVLAPFLDSDIYYSWDPDRRVTSATLLPYFMNKGEIIKLMQKRLHITAENTLVAGDGINDWHMFDPAIARWAVCPDNADSRIKDIVRKMGGIVAGKRYAWGVVAGAQKIINGLK